MTVNYIERLGTNIDEAFFVIGVAMFVIEIAKALFTRTLAGRGVLDMLANVSTQIPYLLVEIFLLSSAYAGYVWLSNTLVLWQIPVNGWTALLAVLVADFVYYWEHRFAHEVRILWTQHAVHHSSRFMNMTVGVRFGPFEGVATVLFHLPMLFIGFAPELIFFGIIVVLAYQTWIHTELIGRLGPLEGILNTPSNHRVHHGCDDKYIDRNYGGILMIWDRAFGTYQREEETPRYGLKGDFNSVNPLVVWFSEMPGFFRDLMRARSAREAAEYIIGRPGFN